MPLHYSPCTKSYHSLKLALSVISNDTNYVILNFKGPVYCTKNLKLMFKASKLWMPKPQELIFQHPLEPEASPEGDIKCYQQ